MPKKGKEKKKQEAPAAPPVEDPASEQIMHAQELASKRASVDHYRAECERLRKINHKLKQEMFEREKNSFEVIDTWRKKVDQQQQENDKLKEKMSEDSETHERERIYAEELWSAKIEVVQKELETTEETKEREIAALTTKVNDLNDFAAKQDILERELEALTVEKRELEEAKSETVVKMERKFIEEKARLQKDINKKLLAFKQASEAKVNDNLDASTKRILMQNRQMADELRLHVQETNELLKTKARLTSECKRLTRESELQKQKVAEFASRGAAQQRQIQEGQDKVKNLERSLSKVVHDFEAERKCWEDAAGGQAASAVREAASLRTQLRARQRELKTLRRLAKDILRQRSDVEQFFLDSLELVKERALAERSERKRYLDQQYLQQVREATLRKGVAFPSIRRTPGDVSLESRLPTSADQKVDLGQLTWEDREQVLRLLFAKINHSSQQQYRAVSAPQQSGGGDDGYGYGGGGGGGSDDGMQMDGVPPSEFAESGPLVGEGGGGLEGFATASRPEMV